MQNKEFIKQSKLWTWKQSRIPIDRKIGFLTAKDFGETASVAIYLCENMTDFWIAEVDFKVTNLANIPKTPNLKSLTPKTLDACWSEDDHNIEL